METPDEFRSRVRAAHRPAFDLFGRVVDLVEPAVAHRRFLSGEVERALDMLMLQGYKAHCSLYVLAVRAHIEDAATIVRRLLELAIQTIYIASQSPQMRFASERVGTWPAYGRCAPTSSDVPYLLRSCAHGRLFGTRTSII